jgi:hypothetical protein
VFARVGIARPRERITSGDFGNCRAKYGPQENELVPQSLCRLSKTKSARKVGRIGLSRESRFFKPTILRYNWDSFTVNGRLLLPIQIAPLAQLDRATGYEPVGREFESLRAHHP